MDLREGGCWLEPTPGEHVLPNLIAPSASKAEPRPIRIEELFSAYQHQVSVWVRRLGGPRIEVEDAVQEVFLIAHRRLHHLHERQKLAIWLYRVTENVVLHHRRRLGRQLRFLEGRQAPVALEIAAPEEAASEDEARRRELELIYKVLDRMSERNRTLIILFELEELSGQEIADLRGAKLSTVWVWLHRARAEFRRQVTALEQTVPWLRELKR